MKQAGQQGVFRKANLIKFGLLCTMKTLTYPTETLIALDAMCWIGCPYTSPYLYSMIDSRVKNHFVWLVGL